MSDIRECAHYWTQPSEHDPYWVCGRCGLQEALSTPGVVMGELLSQQIDWRRIKAGMSVDKTRKKARKTTEK